MEGSTTNPTLDEQASAQAPAPETKAPEPEATTHTLISNGVVTTTPIEGAPTEHTSIVNGVVTKTPITEG